ncbi:MAG: tyrosine-type recombinase/integrase [Acidimicrobiales bacterium]
MNRELRARVLLEEARALGLDVGDLLAAATGEPKPVTVTAWIDEIGPTFGPSTAATYRSYWRLAAALLGDRYLAELTTTDLAAVLDAAAERARTHRPDSTGRASRETCIAARRALYARAFDAGHVTTNPAAALRKPLRPAGRRRALDDGELTDLADAIRATSTDPNLDLLLVRFHLETGARRQGALNLRRSDIDTTRATVWLREKNDAEREQPASPSLVACAVAHASERGGNDAGDAVFRNRRGELITERRYDRLFARARDCLGWDARIPVSAHVLRHTAVTRIGRIAGYPVAQAFAGHAPPSVTGRYLHASPADVATAVAALTGEDHPLAHPGRDNVRRSCADPRR